VSEKAVSILAKVEKALMGLSRGWNEFALTNTSVLHSCRKAKCPAGKGVVLPSRGTTASQKKLRIQHPIKIKPLIYTDYIRISTGAEIMF
jgi:hypothetical protein